MTQFDPKSMQPTSVTLEKALTVQNINCDYLKQR